MSTQVQPEHLAKTAFYIMVLLTSLGFIQYALINWNTQQSWYPFIAGPLLAVSFLFSLAIVAFAGDYQLGVVMLMLFIVLTLITYALTFDHSTIIDYEYMIVLLALMLADLIYLDYVEGSVDLKPVHLMLIFSATFLPYLAYVLAAFKLGSYYGYITMVLALILALANLLLFVPLFTEHLIQTLILTTIVLMVFVVYVLSAGIIGPDVTEWMLRATLLSSYLALVWTAVRSGWE